MRHLLFFSAILFFISCGERDSLPRPRAYPRVILPVRDYQEFDKNYCNFDFEYPKYGVIRQEKNYFEEKAPDPCWFNIEFPTLNATLHCSYYPIRSQKDYEKHTNDAFTMANKHNVKANFIDELPIYKSKEVKGMLFNIQGPAASPCQFFLTDSVRHYMRGSLYFNGKTDADSLAPVVNFIKDDIVHMINTFSWKKQGN
jgi:gliding motility-associated lipoprotein GldD